MKFMCILFGHPKRDQVRRIGVVAEGFPPHQMEYHTVFRCKRCGEYYLRVGDSMCQQLRPWYMPIERDYMTYYDADIPKHLVPYREVKWRAYQHWPLNL
jgi:hypothetical protein